MGMLHGQILVKSISDIDDTSLAPLAGPEGSLGRLALNSDLPPKKLVEAGTDIHIDSIPLDTGENSANWTVLIKSEDGENIKTSNVIAVWKDDGSEVNYFVTSTQSIGDVSSVSLVVDFSTSINLKAIITSGTWEIRSVRLSI